jgi:hypothetical protein
MKPAPPRKQPGRTPHAVHTVPFIVRGLLLLFAVISAILVLWLVITLFFLFIPHAGADPKPTAISRQPLPTLAAVIPTPFIYPVDKTGIGVPLPTPTAIESVVIAAAISEATVTVAWPTPTQGLPTPEPAAPSPAMPTLEPPQRVALNGIPYETIIVMPEDVIARSREIFLAGQAIGRNPRSYSKVGDSTTENPHFLTRFDTGPYNLGNYAFLQPVIDHFLGSHGRDSVAVRIGLHSWTANDPAWADPGLCQPNETPVQCEIRIHNPAVLLIRLGTNDVGVPTMFDGNVRQIVETAITNGVIPVIATRAVTRTMTSCAASRPTITSRCGTMIRWRIPCRVAVWMWISPT